MLILRLPYLNFRRSAVTGENTNISNASNLSPEVRELFFSSQKLTMAAPTLAPCNSAAIDLAAETWKIGSMI